MRTIIAMHERETAKRGTMHGIRDENLLQSAVQRPIDHYQYAEAPTLLTTTAALGYGLAKNHAFRDGNKRISFVATLNFLSLNAGAAVDFKVSEDEIIHTWRSIADGTLSEDQLAAWLDRNVVLNTSPDQAPRD
ncbi:type II toxin-antitoxin system death-on-curing family toxin [Jiella mangrovi]